MFKYCFSLYEIFYYIYIPFISLEAEHEHQGDASAAGAEALEGVSDSAYWA